MIGDLLRRLHIRYFGPRATSVPLQIEPTSFSQSFSDVKIHWSDVPQDDWSIVLPHGVEPEQPRPGIQPPPDPAIEGWTWSAWKRELDAGAMPGWAFCRFANRIGPDDAAFVFGIVRGSFGIWRQPFEVCHEDDGQSSKILSCVTHLRSGLGIGICADRAIAAQAAEVADYACPGWATLEPEPRSAWDETYSRTRTAWQHLGIAPASDSHCHDQHGNMFAILTHSPAAMMQGRPEKLS